MSLSLAALSAPALFALASLSQPFPLHEDLNPPVVFPPQPKLVEALAPGVYTLAESADFALFSHSDKWSEKNPTYLLRTDISGKASLARFFLLPCANAKDEDLYLMQVQQGGGATSNTFVTLQGSTGFTTYALYKSNAPANAAGLESIAMSNARTSAAFVVEACDLLISNYVLAPDHAWRQKVVYSSSTP
jgi:hypothetical protein